MMRRAANIRSRYRRFAALRRDQAGAALVEFTIIAPLLFTLGLGLFEFGNFLYQYQMVLEGLRDGARYLARLDPTDGTNQANAKNLATTGTIDGTGEERVNGWTADDVTVNPVEYDNAGDDFRGEATIYTVELSTDFDYADFGFLSAIGLDAISVSASHQQRAIVE